MGHQLALASARVTADMVMTTEYPHLAQRYAVMAVPKIVINETRAFDGALPEELFLEQVVAAASGAGPPTGSSRPSDTGPAALYSGEIV